MPRSSDSERMWRIAARYSVVGMEIAVQVAIGTLGGTWLDERFGTEPYLFWIGTGVGLAAAVRSVVRVVKGTHLDQL